MNFIWRIIRYTRVQYFKHVQTVNKAQEIDRPCMSEKRRIEQNGDQNRKYYLLSQKLLATNDVVSSWSYSLMVTSAMTSSPSMAMTDITMSTCSTGAAMSPSSLSTKTMMARHAVAPLTAARSTCQACVGHMSTSRCFSVVSATFAGTRLYATSTSFSHDESFGLVEHCTEGKL